MNCATSGQSALSAVLAPKLATNSLTVVGKLRAAYGKTQSLPDPLMQPWTQMLPEPHELKPTRTPMPTGDGNREYPTLKVRLQEVGTLNAAFKTANLR
jgi:hypothetical protein